MPANTRKGVSSVRIIGGTLRRRLIYFPEINDLRPTPNRVRETLFNWLTPHIRGAKCLDMFAGSGALGFEALSREASYCLMVDSSAEVIATLEENRQNLLLNNLKIVQATFPYSVETIPESFDIVFLDPPFHSDYLEKASLLLVNNDCLNKNALVYVELEKGHAQLKVPSHWRCLKDQVAGKVRYCLFQA